MTVKELKEKVNRLPSELDDMDVLINQKSDDFALSPLETIEVQKVRFAGEGVKSYTEDCLVLTDS
jgi:hypothetical protein